MATIFAGRAAPPESWLRVRPEGLHVEPGGFTIDPMRAVERAVVTHGHADHARPGQGTVLATRETAAIMSVRYGARAARSFETPRYGEPVRIGDVTVRLVPAGHVLGSAQIMLEYGGTRVVVSGDYKRRPDPTCAPFEPVPCDLFVTEATFALPVYRHPPAAAEIARLRGSLALFPERAHLVGAYGLGKCQRLLALMREAGHNRPVYVHASQIGLCRLYEELGVDLGNYLPLSAAGEGDLAGAVVLAPPGSLSEPWARRLPDPVLGMASGWMSVRSRVRGGGIELPLVLSDHADWDELCRTLRDVAAPEVWITHGPHEALAVAAEAMGIRARALSLVGYGAGDEAEE